MKKLLFVQTQERGHWVGDGFPVRSIFSYRDRGAELSPFLLLDYAGPADFEPSDSNERRGVGEHPHRGFETVTIIYSGEVEHRDSTGAGGIIGPGDVQWMTAASGIVHEEFHGPGFSRKGGRFEVIQLWVNLPAMDKMAAPGYQGITAAQIPTIELADNAGVVRVIAGKYNGTAGPAQTFTHINLWDLKLSADSRIELDLPDGFTTALFVLHGQIELDDGDFVGDAQIAVFDRNGSKLALKVVKDTTLLLLSGQPINEPITGQGPFVMNTPQEIRQAVADYSSGRMGRITGKQ